MLINLRPELEELIRNISTRNLYGGNRIPDSIMKQFTIEETDTSMGILVPYWLPVVEHGRGPRKRNINFGLQGIIYKWMEKHNIFAQWKPPAVTKSQKNGAAFVVTRYINKHGNEQFRKNIFIDVYTTERQKTIEKINAKFSLAISKITTEIL